MNILTKIIGFMAVFCTLDASHAALRAGGATTAATGRVSISTPVVSSASRRIPTMSVNVTAQNVNAPSASLMLQTECIDSYTECIKGDDACGSNFEECTTNELFFAKKPNCNSVLMQCASAGISALFGTSDTNALAAMNANGEYVYPTAGSILGQYIAAGAISNRLDAGKCVQQYTRCLHKDNVCGEDFELCTSDSEFKKQKVYCESVLARCTDEGKTELFGSTNTTIAPSAGSRIRTMIVEGADLAAANAVSTCYKVADQCILNACAANPLRCIEDTDAFLADSADSVNGEPPRTNQQVAGMVSGQISKSDVNKHLRNACFDTIGGNKYCHITTKGATPTASQMRDEFERDEVFTNIYASRKNAVVNKLVDLRNKFDTRAKDKCVETITSCAVRTCGGGVGSVCYQQVFKQNSNKSINEGTSYNEIKNGCAAIVNTDVNCQYAAAATKNSAYSYAYYDADTFSVVFPEYGMGADPTGVVEKLNASLAANYNDAAIANLAKQCKTTAESCIRSMCGADFANCYRNRTDIMGDAYATDNDKFNRSMNKVSGILDFTIIRGLCASAVKNSKACEEHLKIQIVKQGL